MGFKTKWKPVEWIKKRVRVMFCIWKCLSKGRAAALCASCCQRVFPHGPPNVTCITIVQPQAIIEARTAFSSSCRLKKGFNFARSMSWEACFNNRISLSHFIQLSSVTPRFLTAGLKWGAKTPKLSTATLAMHAVPNIIRFSAIAI